jgi:hypothetical protein
MDLLMLMDVMMEQNQSDFVRTIKDFLGIYMHNSVVVGD